MKHYSDLLSEYSEEALFNDESGAYAELFEFIGVTKPKRRGIEAAEPKSSRGTKQRETSVISQATAASNEENASARSKRTVRAGRYD